MISGIFNTYHDYICSDIWDEKCDYLMKQRGYYCEICNNPENPRVHHKNYRNLGNEGKDDLIILCNFCHQMTHEYAFPGRATVHLESLKGDATILIPFLVTNIKWTKEEGEGKIRVYLDNRFIKEVEVCNK